MTKTKDIPHMLMTIEEASLAVSINDECRTELAARNEEVVMGIKSDLAEFLTQFNSTLEEHRNQTSLLLDNKEKKLREICNTRDGVFFTRLAFRYALWAFLVPYLIITARVAILLYCEFGKC